MPPQKVRQPDRRRHRLLAPVGVVNWRPQAEPEEAGILTLFLVPVWRLLVIFGLLIGRLLGMLATGGKRVLQR